MKVRILKWLMPKLGYNPAGNPNILHNQWEHQKFLWGLQSYEGYAEKQRNP